MREAFKEWALVVDALGRGEQILILRKGGIHEGREGFQMEHNEFLLFPTLFHQQREFVIPSAQSRFDDIAPHLSPHTPALQYWARVHTWVQVDSLEAARRLEGQHIWRDEVIAERFDWGRHRGLFAIALRVYRLPEPVRLPMIPLYGGCKSWVELDREVSVEGAFPVLQESAFEEKLRRFRSALALRNAA